MNEWIRARNWTFGKGDWCLKCNSKDVVKDGKNRTCAKCGLQWITSAP